MHGAVGSHSSPLVIDSSVLTAFHLFSANAVILDQAEIL